MSTLTKRAIAVIGMVGLTVACSRSSGSSGGGEPPPSATFSATTFIAALSDGDLIDFDLNPVTNTFSWVSSLSSSTSTRPASGSGTLTPTPGFGKYVYSTPDWDNVALLPNGLLMIADSFGGLGVGVPKATTRYTVNDIAGMYNVVRWEHSTRSSDFGTFELLTNGTFRLWHEENGATTAEPPYGFGTWNDAGGGMIQGFDLRYPTEPAFIAMFKPDGDESLLVVCTVSEPGMALGVRQRAVPTTGLTGVYNVCSTDFLRSRIVPATVNGPTASYSGNGYWLVHGYPWTGFTYCIDRININEEEIIALLSPDGTLFGIGIGENRIPFVGYDWLFAGIRR